MTQPNANYPQWLTQIMHSTQLLEHPYYQCTKCGQPWAYQYCDNCQRRAAREKSDELIRQVLADANLAIEVRTWLPHWENRRLPMLRRHA